MSNKQTSSDLVSNSPVVETAEQYEGASLMGIKTHKILYKDFYDYVDNHERKYSLKRNVLRAGGVVALFSAAALGAFVSGAETLPFSVGSILIGSYLYGLHVKSDFNIAHNCRQVINHHNLVIDYLNDNHIPLENGDMIEHNQAFPIEIMEEVDNKSLNSYVYGELERQKRNIEAGNKPAIVDKAPRANKEGRQIIYSNNPL